MTGEAFFLLRLLRGALRIAGDRRVLGGRRCSEHEVARELLRDSRRAALRAREPGSALRVGFNSDVALSFTARCLPTSDPLLHSTHVVDVAGVVVVARDAQSTGAKWIAAAVRLLPTEMALG
jgi:hypothetical protein